MLLVGCPRIIAATIERIGGRRTKSRRVGWGGRVAAACALARGLRWGRVGDVYAWPRVLRWRRIEEIYAMAGILRCGRAGTATCRIGVLSINTNQGQKKQTFSSKSDVVGVLPKPSSAGRPVDVIPVVPRRSASSAEESAWLKNRGKFDFGNAKYRQYRLLWMPLFWKGPRQQHSRELKNLKFCGIGQPIPQRLCNLPCSPREFVRHQPICGKASFLPRG